MIGWQSSVAKTPTTGPHSRRKQSVFTNIRSHALPVALFVQEVLDLVPTARTRQCQELLVRTRASYRNCRFSEGVTSWVLSRLFISALPLGNADYVWRYEGEQREKMTDIPPRVS